MASKSSKVLIIFTRKNENLKKCNKFVCSFYDKNNYGLQIRTLKQALTHKAIQLNEKACLKSYIDINTKLAIEEKNDFEKRLFEAIKT